MPAVYDQISVSTLPAFQKGMVSRTLFTATAMLRMLRSNKAIRRQWQGGALQFVPFENQPLPAGPYSPGTDVFSLEERQTFDGMTFAIKPYRAEVVINAAVTDLYNTRGPHQIVDVLKEKYGNGSNSLDSQVAADAYNHGQNLASGNRIKALNGLAELGDGFTPSWTGDVFTQYGNQTKNSATNGTVLNMVPYWGGNPDGSSAPITLQVLNGTYWRCKKGKGEGNVIGGEPDMGFASDFLMGRIVGLVYPMQRADVGVREVRVGMNGVKINNAIVLADSYCPGLQNALYVQDQSVLSRITTTTITNPASTNTNVSLSNFPLNSAAPNLTVGETFWWWNTNTWRFVFPNSGIYSGKYSGMQQAIDGDMRADVLRLAMLLYTLVPSANQASYGYNG